MTSLPDKTERKLGLVIDLDTCVGCHACVISCKGWNTENYGSPLADVDAYGENPVGTFLNRNLVYIVRMRHALQFAQRVQVTRDLRTE